MTDVNSELVLTSEEEVISRDRNVLLKVNATHCDYCDEHYPEYSTYESAVTDNIFDPHYGADHPLVTALRSGRVHLHDAVIMPREAHNVFTSFRSAIKYHLKQKLNELTTAVKGEL